MPKVQQARQVRREPQGHREAQVPKETRERKALRVRRVRRVVKAHKVQQVRREPQARQAQEWLYLIRRCLLLLLRTRCLLVPRLLSWRLLVLVVAGVAVREGQRLPMLAVVAAAAAAAIG